MTEAEIVPMTPSEFASRATSGELWRLLDVREPWEVQIANVAAAVTIPMAELPARVGELDQQSRIAVICHSGVRSARVAAWLRQQGFANVANIDGGIDAWSVEVDGAIPRY
jgi:rhodanese-related sulfurtransferase